MRIWSIHPKYLDTKGLVAAWREGLLAKKVLEGKTKGYIKHPQLCRFYQSLFPLDSINWYLQALYDESISRNYHFDKTKIGNIVNKNINIFVTTGQISYELKLLKYKLQKRDITKYKQIQYLNRIELNRLFIEVPGNIENWEKINLEIVELE